MHTGASRLYSNEIGEEELADIKPFKGILFNKGIIGDMETVVAPPYDVISDEEQKRLLKENKFNVVRLILPQGSLASKYARASEAFNSWLEKGILIRDIEPAIYIYEQEYRVKNKQRKRLGFIALVKLEDFSTGKVKAHEKTLKGPKDDRLRLIRACRANFSQIFSLFSDPERTVDRVLEEHTKEKPRIDIRVDGVTHRLWTINNTEAIQLITGLMRDKQLFIADGHHRYETALNFRNEMRLATGDTSTEAPYDYTMMMFVNMDSEGLTILSTHRALKNLPKINYDKFKDNLKQIFDIEKLPSIESVMSKLSDKQSTHAIGLYYGADNFYLLQVKNEDSIVTLLDVKQSREWKLLDVTILHQVIINRILGFGGTNIENSIKFTTDEHEAVSAVANGTHQMAFFLNPTKISSVKEIASAGEIMPQKSTYFYPKLLTGLVFNKLEW